MLKVLLVINKLVKEIVVLIPDKIILKIAISWAPIPVYFMFEEKGVIKVQPLIVYEELEHLTKKFFFLLSKKIFLEK
jgi:hypothetical protein